MAGISHSDYYPFLVTLGGVAFGRPAIHLNDLLWPALLRCARRVASRAVAAKQSAVVASEGDSHAPCRPAADRASAFYRDRGEHREHRERRRCPAGDRQGSRVLAQMVDQAAALAMTRATVVCVQVPPPLGVGTPRRFRPRAICAMLTAPAVRLYQLPLIRTDAPNRVCQWT